MPREAAVGPVGEHHRRSDLIEPCWFCPGCGEEFMLSDLTRNLPFTAVNLKGSVYHAACGGSELRRIYPPDPAEGSLEDYV